MNNKSWLWVIGFILLCFIVVASIAGNSANTTGNNATPSSPTHPSASAPLIKGQSISREDAINEHWDEISQYVDGTETIEACSQESNNCYDLDADISSGTIDTIHFPSGGYLDFSADIDSDGSASDTDVNGNNWDFTLDMNSSIVDDALTQWANAGGYTIQ